MNAEANQRKMGWFARRLIVLPALVVALSLAFTEAASAQTPFQASVTFTGTVPFAKAGGCSNGAFFCGTANIAGYGAASWNYYVLGFTAVQTPCGSTNTAVTDFTLAGDANSTLVIDESANLCGLGNDGAAYRAYFTPGSKDFGRPYAIVGNWTTHTDCAISPEPVGVPCSSGQFAGLGGSGTDLVNTAGAHAAGSYSGTLG